MPPPCCVCDCMSTLILQPPYCLPWYDPRPSPSSCPWGRDPVLLIVPGTGAPSPRPHCSPPLAALHLHLLTPSMPSPRSQLIHMARYPTATHHPSKSGSIRVSQVAQCDVMLFPSYVTPPPSPDQTPAWWDRCMGSSFYLSVSNFVVWFRLKTGLFVSDSAVTFQCSASRVLGLSPYADFYVT